MNSLVPRLLTIFVLVLLPAVCLAQIPNGDFEHWTGNQLDGWAVTNTELFTTVSPTTAAHSGTYAVSGQTVAFYITVLGPTIQSGPGGHGFIYTGRPAAFTGWYKFSPQGGDRFGVNVLLTKGGTEGIAIASAAWAPSDAVGSYTQFSVPFTYLTNDTPDTCYVQILIVGPGTGAASTPHAGSSYILDDIAFSGAADVAETGAGLPGSFVLNQNFPNPFNPSTTVSYDLPSSSDVRLAVFDILGREVATLVNEHQSAGKHAVKFDGTNLPSGFYLYRLQAGAMTSTKRMVLVK